MHWHRRATLRAWVFGCFAAQPACISALGGAFSEQPEALATSLSPQATALVDEAYADVAPFAMVDYHTHIVGLGVGGTGCFVNEAMRAPLRHPVRYTRFSIYMSAGGIADADMADAQYIERLVHLTRGAPKPSRHLILAFDQHYRRDGSVDLEETEFYTPNDYVVSLARAYPDVFVPAMSVHPYRKDALAELERLAAVGVRYVKWLPNAMGIDPADPLVVPFYDKMRALDLVLLTHAGTEKAVEAEDDQELGNPLRLRAALDAGVKVIVAHCASLGEGEDLDAPTQPLVPNFELFLRLLREPRYRGLVYGEISAVTQFNRLPGPARYLLAHPELHDRLVNGSDYPLPAVNVVIRVDDLVDAGVIDASDADALREIYDVNPLVFDYVVKRRLRDPVTGQRLLTTIFRAHPDVPQP